MNLRVTIWLLGFSVAIAGCSQSEEPIIEETPVVAPAAPPASDAAKPAAAASSPDQAKSVEPIPAAVAQFAPPFPDRLDLFEPPQRAQGSVRRDEESGQTVELMGFINVNEPKAVLSIDGVISAIPEGGEKYGVLVISIEPPSVDYRRGRIRDRATLE